MLYGFKALGLIGLGLSAFAGGAQAALTYPGCADVKASDFTVVPLINNATDKSVQEPIKMAFDMDASGNVDVYFTQRFGKVRKWSGARRAMITIADFAFTAAQLPDTRHSKGLNGIVLDPGFKTNHWAYIYIGLDNDWHVSRFRVEGDKLDLATERQIFQFDGGGKATTHVAGALHFDVDGNLWISNAENEAESPSANTNSYLGKILRIKPIPFADGGAVPKPGMGTTYEIPTGNLYPVGTAKTLPEIYIMGARNPYTFSLDAKRKAVAWGDVGPDGYGQTEEYNLARKPGNYGYPGWAGNNKALKGQGYGTPAAPLNNQPDNTGLTTLPAVQLPLLAYNEACAISGPIYYYDASVKSAYKWPPHFNGAWIISDFNSSYIDALELDDEGTKILSRMPILAANAGGQLNKPGDVQMGPDGALYVMNYSGFRSWNAQTGLLRVEYHGDCHPVSNVALTLPGPRFRLEGTRLRIDYAGRHRLSVADPLGRLESLQAGAGPAEYELGAGLAPGLHILRIVFPGGVRTATFIR